MDAFADLVAVPHRGDKVLRKVLGVARHEAKAELSVYFVDGAKQVREGFVSVSIRVHVLPKERYLFVSFLNGLLGLGENIRKASASLAAFNVRHYAVRTEVVAAERDVHPGVRVARSRHRAVLVHSAVRLHREDLLLFARCLSIQQTLEVLEVVRAEHDVHEGKPL